MLFHAFCSWGGIGVVGGGGSERRAGGDEEVREEDKQQDMDRVELKGVQGKG